MRRAALKSKVLDWLFHLDSPYEYSNAVATVAAVVCSVLTPREQWVFRMHELNRFPLSVMARRCGVSREVLARLHRSACRKLDREIDFLTSHPPLKDVWKKYLPGMKPWEDRKRRR